MGSIGARKREGGGKEAIAPSPGSAVAVSTNGTGKKKLSYLEAREYASIEQKVDEAEARLNAARDVLDDPAVATNADALTKALHEMEQAQGEADGLYQRWAELTEKAG